MAKSSKSKATTTAAEVEPVATPAVSAEAAATAAKPKKKTRAATPPEVVAAPVAGSVPMAPTHDEVRRRAYELWLAHGGSSMENWLAAERQLRG